MMSRACTGLIKASTRRGNVFKHIRYATSSVTQPGTSQSIQSTQDGQLTEAGSKPKTNVPFVKNLFLGEFDKVTVF